MKPLKCPVCHREVAPAFAPGAEEAAAAARKQFLVHAERQHGVGEIDALLYFAEAIRRRPSAA